MQDEVISSASSARAVELFWIVLRQLHCRALTFFSATSWHKYQIHLQVFFDFCPLIFTSHSPSPNIYNFKKRQFLGGGGLLWFLLEAAFFNLYFNMDNSCHNLEYLKSATTFAFLIYITSLRRRIFLLSVIIPIIKDFKLTLTKLPVEIFLPKVCILRPSLEFFPPQSFENLSGSTDCHSWLGAQHKTHHGAILLQPLFHPQMKVFWRDKRNTSHYR